MKKNKFPIILILFIALGLSIYLILPFAYMNLYRPFQIAGDAMHPTLQDNEYYIADIRSAKSGNVSSGDMVVFRAPKDPDKDYVKRIIGVPGDKVMIKDGDVFLNSQLLEEKYSNGAITYTGAFIGDGEERTVPKDNYFVLGDNRPYSSDSREWGFVPKENLVGKIMFCYYNCK